MPRRRWSEAQMRELLREHERSGVSLKSFAESAGIAYTTLAWWRKRLRPGRDAPSFVRVRVRESARARVEIVVGDVVVRVADGDDAAVARLVRAIAESGRGAC